MPHFSQCVYVCFSSSTFPIIKLIIEKKNALTSLIKISLSFNVEAKESERARIVLFLEVIVVYIDRLSSCWEKEMKSSKRINTTDMASLVNIFEFELIIHVC